jgi:integrase
MRRGEMFRLKWEDLYFERHTIRIVRSLVDQIKGKPNTETSRKPLPMADDLATALTS